MSNRLNRNSNLSILPVPPAQDQRHKIWIEPVWASVNGAAQARVIIVAARDADQKTSSNAMVPRWEAAA